MTKPPSFGKFADNFATTSTQNRNSAAIQAKLNELILASAARNDLIGIEHLPQEEVEKFRRLCESARGKSGSPFPLLEQSDASGRSGPAL